MIYEPRVAVNLYEIIGGALIRAALLALGDFIAEDNKPWSHYLGAAFGYAAAATGIPGAAAILYVVGESVDVALLHSPDGSLADVFLDGVLVASVDTYAGSNSWVTTVISGLTAGILHQIRIVNTANPNGDKTSTIEWLALGPITVNGSGAYALGAQTMAHNTIIFRLQDAETDVVTGSIPVYVPTGLLLDSYQSWASAMGALIDLVTGSKIAAIEMVVRLDLPGGIKASPVAASLNERGGLISFDTSGPNKDSVRIPAITTTIMPGDSFLITETNIANLITKLTTSTAAGAETLRPVTTDEFNWVAARKGSKSLRR